MAVADPWSRLPKALASGRRHRAPAPRRARPVRPLRPRPGRHWSGEDACQEFVELADAIDPEGAAEDEDVAIGLVQDAPRPHCR
jgi:hypothetical protein